MLAFLKRWGRALLGLFYPQEDEAALQDWEEAIREEPQEHKEMEERLRKMERERAAGRE